MIKNTRHKIYFSRDCCSLIRCIFLAILAAKSSVSTWQHVAARAVGFLLPSASKDIKKQLKTLDNIQDKDIDYSDSPDMGDANWAEFKAFNPTKKMISIRLDSDLIDYFKSLGGSYQSKINMVLREYKRHQNGI